jgi:hypothetical protein
MATHDGRVPDGTGLSQAEPVSRLGPSGFDPSRKVRRTLSKWDDAPLDGTPFHILNTLRFNPFASRWEGLCHTDEGGHAWREVSLLAAHPPTWWMRLVPLPYELPQGFAFTLTYEARRKTWRDRLVERLFGSLSRTVCMASMMHRWTAIATETRRAETTKIGSVEDEGAGRQASPKGQRP